MVPMVSVVDSCASLRWNLLLTDVWVEMCKGVWSETRADGPPSKSSLRRRTTFTAESLASGSSSQHSSIVPTRTARPCVEGRRGGEGRGVDGREGGGDDKREGYKG